MTSNTKKLLYLPLNGLVILAGISGGILGFYASKGLAMLVNISKAKCSITPEMEKRLKVLFPGMLFKHLKIICNAWLPAHIFNKSIKGMTFNNRIYVVHQDIEHQNEGFMLLIHELVHIKQIRQSGEFLFACKYGLQFIANGGYSNKMPLEEEAFKFEEKTKTEDFIKS